MIYTPFFKLHHRDVQHDKNTKLHPSNGPFKIFKLIMTLRWSIDHSLDHVRAVCVSKHIKYNMMSTFERAAAVAAVQVERPTLARTTFFGLNDTAVCLLTKTTTELVMTIWSTFSGTLILRWLNFVRPRWYAAMWYRDL